MFFLNQIICLVICLLNLFPCHNGCPKGFKPPECREGCSPGTFGINCTELCTNTKCNLETNTCNHVDGSCASCHGFWRGGHCTECDGTGENCDKARCGQCNKKFSGCNPITGECNGGCQRGWMPPLCKLACFPGTFGINCTELCINTKCNLETNTCNHVDGSCAKCHGFWRGGHCTECDRTGGNCDKVSCGQCNTETSGCNPITGECNGGCQRGWMPPLCKLACPFGKYGINCSQLCSETNCDFNFNTCNHIDGSCFSCKPGWKGHYCTECDGEHCKNNFTCGKCNVTIPGCDPVSGYCFGGCQNGWKPPVCQEACSPGTYGMNCTKLCSNTNCNLDANMCNHIDGSCKECKSGWTGHFCTECDGTGENCKNIITCGKCNDKNPSCDPVSGYCIDGCQNGWKPPVCQEACSPGTYGKNCTKQCSNTNCNLDANTCNHRDGSCKDCKSGWTGHFCTEKNSVASTSSTATIVGSVIGVILVVLIGTIVFLCYYKKRKRAKSQGPGKIAISAYKIEDLDAMEEYDDVETPQYLKNTKTRNSYTNYVQHLPLSKINWNDIKKLGILGKGHFGEVWKGMLVKQNNKIVAIKTLRDSASDLEWQEFVQEMKVMQQIGDHPNIIKLLGLCYHEYKIFMIMEYLVNGDLNTFLRKSRLNKNDLFNQTELSTNYLLQIAIGTAKGMDHLAKKQILHRDLAARNVLIGDDGAPKISDFGLARKGTLYLKVSNSLLPIRWMAVESFEEQIYTTKSDVWSFGVLLWEIATLGATPYYGVQAHVLIAKIRSGYRLMKPPNCNDDMYQLMANCWATNPMERPDFFQLTDYLSDMLANNMGYLQIIDNQEGDNYAPIDESLEQY